MTPHSKRDKLAVDLTRQASKQTYTIFRLLADRDHLLTAHRAYAYFRWLDDLLDSPSEEPGHNHEALKDRAEKLEFVKRQRELLEDLYQGRIPPDLSPQETLLLDLVQGDPNQKSGLYLYLDNMMKVMEVDAERRGRQITESELDHYTTALAVSVTEILHYVIGHHQPEPQTKDRYLAVQAAHITHMLRDTLEDAQDGYFNIPREYLVEHQITPFDVQSEAYRSWVCEQVQLAHRLFEDGNRYISRGKNFRRRLTGLAYAARFEWMLKIIERENFCLREGYPDRKKLSATLWMFWYILKSIWGAPFKKQNYLKLPHPGDETGMR